jgi:replicative DNA helicase
MGRFFDHDAEMGVVGSLLQRPEYIRRIPFLKVDDISDNDCKKVFRIFAEEGGLAELGGKIPHSKFIEMENSAPSPELIFGYAKQVKELSLKRCMSNMLEEIDNKTPGEIIDGVKELERGLPFTLTEHKPYTLPDLIEDIRNTPEGLKTGYRDLDKYITIPMGGIAIVAGRTSHGKTTFLLNICLNMIDIYPDKAFLFFSYEENSRQVALRILNTLSGKVITDTYSNYYQLENYLRGDNTSRPEIEAGKDRLREITENGKLWIIDEPYYIAELTKIIANLGDKYDVGAVFIDYIQKIKVREKYATRQLALQDISKRILEVSNKLSLPIILGCQFGREESNTKKKTVRLDNLREAGDIEQDANIVLGLWNPATKIDEKQKDKIDIRNIKLSVTILKSRDGIQNRDVDLIFDAPVLKIKNPIL